jgi:hypothetical protein
MPVGSVAHINRLAGFHAILGLIMLLGQSGCFSPSYRDCQLTCVGGSACPDGLTCDGEGYCRLEVTGPSCFAGEIPDAARPVVDADPEDPDARPTIDASPPIDAPPGTPDAAIDAAPPCTCDPVLQTCCAASETCDLLPPTFTPDCRAPIGTGNQGSVCTSPGQCAEAYTCLEDPAAGTQGTCHLFCTSDDQCQGGGSLCQPRVGTSAQKVCTTNCTPQGGAGCPAAHGCLIGIVEDRVWTDCFVAGAGGQNDTCAVNRDCARGLFCQQNDGPPHCVRYCRRSGGPTGCSGNQQCRALAPTPVVVNGVEYGYCQKPN